jgi:CBS domain-containing protein
MATNGVGSIIVLDESGRPAGIVTDRDFRGRALAGGRASDSPIAGIMTAPIVTVSPEAFVFEALLEMTRRNIHHLAVVEAGRLVGVISSHDLLLLQAAAPLELARMIESRGSIDELITVMPELAQASRRLFEQGLSGYEIGRIVAELNDQVIRRVLELEGADLRRTSGEPPGTFCWLALGSEGRREQTFHTDQDNALVYEDPPRGGEVRAGSYFGELAERVIGALLRLGYPRCPADSMASNPKWCQPLSVWRGYFEEWVRDPVPQHLLYSSIYFDFRPVVGAAPLAVALREEIRTQIKAWRSFPRLLGKLAVSHRPPLGWFGRFVLERKGGVRGINVKLNGMLLLVNAMRAYAIELGLAETNSIERLEAARTAGCFTEDEAHDVRRTYETMFHIRLDHQLRQMAAGHPLDNVIDPSGLGRGDQRRLKEAFRGLRRLQGKVEDRYFTQAL